MLDTLLIVQGNQTHLADVRDMNEYDFLRLNDKEFESLAVDLLAELEGQRIERFKSGKDGGIDGRFFVDGSKEVVIQVKHWARSGLPALIRHLRNNEMQKIHSLNPRRYMLVTSIELSRHNKQVLKDLLSPYVLSETDIFGREDLNDLISKHPEIEKKHYKLWMASTTVLTCLLNAAIVGRSAYKLAEISAFASKYVLTSDHAKALEKLESLHAVIISGEPGIGKTTLADQLCVHYVLRGFRLCCIENSINEAESLYRPKEKQIFYFDDFLGRNYLQALGRHEDSHVINFIKRVSNDKTKRFVLTSRTVILNQGKMLSDLFRIENMEQNEFELRVASLSRLDKARILYNHIWFGRLGEAHVEEVYRDKREV